MSSAIGMQNAMFSNFVMGDEIYQYRDNIPPSKPPPSKPPPGHGHPPVEAPPVGISVHIDP